ncbi:MAG TPA: glycosyltransferase family 2 protein [Bacillota bacterium]|nr:glycosyltransferase family 2 protein [Bacillota bacterium]
MAVIFWLSVSLLAFHYVGYPLLLALLARVKPAQAPAPLKELPSVTLIISVYNEEAIMEKRLKNCLSLDYPRDKLNILVVSDGSTDGTHDIVARYAEHVQLRVVHGRVGKTEALNRVVPELTSDIVVFTDANSMLCPDALLHLVGPFSDDRVGAVCGELRLAGGGPEGVYWRYEKAIKQWESRVSTLTVLNGALYALRRSLHRPMNPQAANDFQHPLQVVLQGYRSVYQPLAVAWEEAPGEDMVEARRRVRIISRGWKGLASNLYVLNPRQVGGFSLQFIARKLLRWLGPVFMFAALTANIFLARHPLYAPFLCLQAAFYGLAAAGFILNKLKIRLLPFYFPYYFCLINWAALLGLIHFLRGDDSATWTPTAQYGR